MRPRYAENAKCVKFSLGLRWAYGGFDSSELGRNNARTCSMSNRNTWPILRPLRMPWSYQLHAVRSHTLCTWATSRSESENTPFRSIGGEARIDATLERVPVERSFLVLSCVLGEEVPVSICGPFKHVAPHPNTYIRHNSG